MQFIPGTLYGVWIVGLEPAVDDRGHFARTFCVREFGGLGLETRFVQHSLSLTRKVGSLRGMHFQMAPHTEVKLVRCVRGAMHDVLIDLRPDSPTYMKWEAFELTPENGRQLYVPAGLAHGFQTLAPDTEAHYLISEFYAPTAASGVRHDDPAFNIAWPLAVAEISDRDRAWPDYVPA